MSNIGPSLPPHFLPKRKRDGGEEIEQEKPAKRRSPSSAATEKKQRIMGPAMPPTLLKETGIDATKDEQATSDSDDDFGPALPSVSKGSAEEATTPPESRDDPVMEEEAPAKLQREEWMLVPPSQGDWVSRIDPTKLKNRRFKTEKGPRAPQNSKGAGDLWTETPEEKRKRLADEVLGVKQPANVEKVERRSTREEAESQEMDKKVKDYNDKYRVASLYKEHQKVNQEKDDDPSQRAFDKEKDMGGSQLSYAKRKEFMNKASSFGSRFSKGSYL